MSTQANFEVRVFDVHPDFEEELAEKIRNALCIAVQHVLTEAGTTLHTITVRGPEIVSLFN